MDPEKKAELVELCKPAMKWLAENWHPHCKLIIESNQVEFMEGIFSEEHNEFLVD